VTLNGANITGTFNGDGSGLTSVSVNALTSLTKSQVSVASWGDNTYGQTTIPAGLTNVTAVAVGISHSLALKDDGMVIAWGTVTTTPAGLSNVTAIAAGNGTVWR